MATTASATNRNFSLLVVFLLLGMGCLNLIPSAPSVEDSPQVEGQLSEAQIETLQATSARSGGSFQWAVKATQSGSSSYTHSNAIDVVVDSSGDAYIACMGSSAYFGAHEPKKISVAKLNSNGVFEWVSTPDNFPDGQVSHIDFDSLGDLLMVGRYKGEGRGYDFSIISPII